MCGAAEGLHQSARHSRITPIHSRPLHFADAQITTNLYLMFIIGVVCVVVSPAARTAEGHRSLHRCTFASSPPAQEWHLGGTACFITSTAPRHGLASACLPGVPPADQDLSAVRRSSSSCSGGGSSCTRRDWWGLPSSPPACLWKRPARVCPRTRAEGGPAVPPCLSKAAPFFCAAPSALAPAVAVKTQ